MSSDDAIGEAYKMLEQCFKNPEEETAAVFTPSDQGGPIIGNKLGFVRLAMASLRAAAGQSQYFESEYWMNPTDTDFPLSGLEYRESLSQTDFEQERRTRLQVFRDSMPLVAVFAAIVIPWSVGIDRIGHWLDTVLGGFFRR